MGNGYRDSEQDRVTMKDVVQREHDKLLARIAELEAENARLREFIKDDPRTPPTIRLKGIP